MRITGLIDSLNSGGAQRQMCMLAILLKKHGCHIQVLTYHKLDFFRPFLEQHGVPAHFVPNKNKLGRVLAVRKAIRGTKPDVVIAYQGSANLIAELAGLPCRDFSLIVSERNIVTGEGALARKIQLFMHQFADAIVTNTYARKEKIEKQAKRLIGRTHVIYNCVALDLFQPCQSNLTMGQNAIHILGLGRFEPQKNIDALVKALKILQEKFKIKNVLVDWYGNRQFKNGHPTRSSKTFVDLQATIEQLQLAKRFRLHGPVQEVVSLYQKTTAVCLPSLWEGLPNVLCEAMACGKPVLASCVGDNARLVKDGWNGFLFDPKSPVGLADVIYRFSKLSSAEILQMGQNSRKRAEELFAPDRFINSYLDLVHEIREK